MSVAEGFRCWKIEVESRNMWVAVFGAMLGKADGGEVLELISRVDRKYGTETQVFDAGKIVGIGHLLHGAKSALRAWWSEESISDSLKIELARHIGAEKQIKEAIKKVGIKKSTKELAFVVLGSAQMNVLNAASNICSNFKRDDSVLKVTPKKRATIMKTYSITRAELSVANIEDLIMERIAMMALS
ncbi:MAG: KEOPS complex subunit Cgi121 [Candidatus Hadarchaeales archaeon]